MMKKTFCKLISAILTICIMMSLLPSTIFATDITENEVIANNVLLSDMQMEEYKESSYRNFDTQINARNTRAHNEGEIFIQSTGTNFDIQQVVNGTLTKFHENPQFSLFSTLKSAGFETVLKTSNTYTRYSDIGLDAKIEADTALYSGKVVRLNYSFYNYTNQNVTFSLATVATPKLSDNTQEASFIPFANKGAIGFVHSGTPLPSDSYRINYYLGDNIRYVTPVDTVYYSSQLTYALQNMWKQISPIASLQSGSHGNIAWSWQNRVIQPKETVTFSVLLSMGDDESANIPLVQKYNVNYSTSLGTKPATDSVYAGETVTLPTLKAPGYSFGGWYTDSQFTNLAGAGGQKYTVNSASTLYAKWSAVQSPVNISLTKDGTSWENQNIALYQNGYLKKSLVYSGGVYSTTAINGIYSIYKDGIATGETVTIASTATSGMGKAVNKTIAYTTLSASTKLDGIYNDTLGNVDFRNAYANILLPTNHNGEYTYIINNSDTDTYSVFIDARDTFKNVDIKDNAVEISYITASAELQLDGNSYQNRIVVFSRKEGSVIYQYLAPYHATTGKYELILPLGPNDNYTYTVSVDGRVLDGVIDESNKSISANYYTASVELKKDNTSWTSTNVSLEKDGLEYPMTHVGNGVYERIVYVDNSAYNVLVKGTNSPQDTGIDLNDNTRKSVDYWTVQFYTTDFNSAYSTRIVQNGKTVDKPTNPRVSERSFTAWCTSQNYDAKFNFANGITSKTSLFAKFETPEIKINDIVQTGDGTYTLSNLTITGFPTTGKPVMSLNVSVDSGTVSVSDNTYAISGNGTNLLTVDFGDGISAEDVQQYLRNYIVAKPISNTQAEQTVVYTPQKLDIALYGNTIGEPSAVSTTKISPVTLVTNGGEIVAGNLTYYQNGTTVTLPTEISKEGYTFEGWYTTETFQGTPVTAFTGTGEKIYYAKWSEGSIDLGAPKITSGTSFIFENAVITDNENLSDGIKSLTISIQNGTVSVSEQGSGYIVIKDLHNKSATVDFATSSNIITTSTISQFLKNYVTFTKDVNSDEYPVITVSVDANPITLPTVNGVLFTPGDVSLNGHYYMYVPDYSISWIDAYNAAKTFTYKGMQGYLVTITSEEEDKILDELTLSAGWSGGTRLSNGNGYDANTWVTNATLNNFSWACGPEKGMTYYLGVANGQPVENSYTNWNDGEPNNSSPSETCMQVHANNYQWNDLAYNSRDCVGYFVEFGGYEAGVDPGQPSLDKTISKTTTISTYQPSVSGNTVYANGSGMIVSDTGIYWDKNNNGVIDDNQPSLLTPTASTVIYAGTNTSFKEVPTGNQITLIDANVDSVTTGNKIEGPIVVQASGSATTNKAIDLDSITTIAVIGALTGATGQLKLKTSTDLNSGRQLAFDKTSSEVIDMSKFVLNSGDISVIAIGKELQISSFDTDVSDSKTITLDEVPPTYTTATVQVMEDDVLTNQQSVVLQNGSNSIQLNRISTGVYSYQSIISNDTYSLYVNDEFIKEYQPFASDTTEQLHYYTAKVTHQVDNVNENAQSVTLRSGMDSLTMKQSIEAETGEVLTGEYEYRKLQDTEVVYTVFVNGVETEETIQFASGEATANIQYYNTNVNLTLDNAIWSGQDVTLHAESGETVYTLSEILAGKYSARIIEGKTDTYKIYINGEDSKSTITPSFTTPTQKTVDYMNVSITTKLDGAKTNIGTVAIGDTIITEAETGVFEATLLVATYDLSIMGKSIGTISADAKQKEVEFFTVTYDANSAEGVLPVDHHIYLANEKVTVLHSGALTKEGHYFINWSDGEKSYTPNATFEITKPITLTAQWGSVDNVPVEWSVDGETFNGTMEEALSVAQSTELPVDIIVKSDISIFDNWTIPQNAILNIPEGVTVTVEKDATLRNEGTVQNEGVLTGEGSMSNTGAIENIEGKGIIDLEVFNQNGNINGGVIGENATVSGGSLNGPVSNNGTIENVEITGDVTNNKDATLTGTTVNGDIVNNGSIIGGAVNGSITNTGSVDGTAVDGNIQNSNGGTISGNSTITGTTNAPGGTVSTPQDLVDALGGAATIDPQTGNVVLNGNVQLDSSIIIDGDITLDLNGNTITGPSGSSNMNGNAEDGKSAIIVTGSADVTIENSDASGNGAIVGGSGGMGSTQNGNGGNGMVVEGNANVTVTENAQVTGGNGGGSGETNSGNGGNGIVANGNTNVTIEGTVTGGNGGSGNVGGDGGNGLVNNTTGKVEIDGAVVGGDGGWGETAGNGGTGLENTTNGENIEIGGSVSGGGGGMDSEGNKGESGGALVGAVAFSILTTNLFNLELDPNFDTSVLVEDEKSIGATNIVIRPTFASLYELPTSIDKISISSVHETISTTLPKSFYTYDANTGTLIIQAEAPINGKVLIFASAIKKTGAVTVTTPEELESALENGFKDIEVGADITLETDIAIGSNVTVKPAENVTITVGNNGSITNNGTIGGEGDVSIENGGSITNNGTIENDGNVTIGNGGNITNNGTMNNSGDITVGNGGLLTNEGSILPTITNNGTVQQIEGAPEITVNGNAVTTVLKIMFNVSGVGIAPDPIYNVTHIPDPLPAMENVGKYVFGGWFTNTLCTTQAVPGAEITTSMTLFAKWTNTTSGGGGGSSSGGGSGGDSGTGDGDTGTDSGTGTGSGTDGGTGTGTGSGTGSGTGTGGDTTTTDGSSIGTGADTSGSAGIGTETNTGNTSSIEGNTSTVPDITEPTDTPTDTNDGIESTIEVNPWVTTIVMQNGEVITQIKYDNPEEVGYLSLHGTTQVLIGDGSITIRIETGDAKDSVKAVFTSLDNVLAACFTAEELSKIEAGETFRITFDLIPIKEVAEADKVSVAEKITELNALGSNLEIGAYFDLTLQKQIGGSDWEKMSELNDELEVAIEIPNDLLREDRSYYAMRVHNGKAELLTDLDSESTTLTIRTSQFSTYALIFEGHGNASPSTRDFTHFIIAVVILLGAFIYKMIYEKTKYSYFALIGTIALSLWIISFGGCIFDWLAIVFGIVAYGYLYRIQTKSVFPKDK